MFWEGNSFTVDSCGQLWMAPYALWYCHVTNRSRDGFSTIKMHKPKNSWDFWMAAMFHRCIFPAMENIAWVSCWADSTIQKEDQWSGFRTAYKAKLCCSLPSDLFTSHCSVRNVWGSTLTQDVQWWVLQALHMGTALFWVLGIRCNAGVDIAWKRSTKLSTVRHKHERALKITKEVEGWTIHQHTSNVKKAGL